jgi:hypothetical protein
MDVGLGPMVFVVPAMRRQCVRVLERRSRENQCSNGVSWRVRPAGDFIFGLATHDNTLYAARADGLWRRSIATVAVRKMSWGSVKALYREPGK